MTYFSANYTRINYPIASDTAIGLRNAQLGAVHSIAAHFTLYNDPALVVMPTGAGKTAVITIVPFLLKAKRVLVLSSSVMVRGQIRDEFVELKTVKNCNVFHRDLPTPTVKEVKHTIATDEDWTELTNFDVVIGIPSRFNKAINGGLLPPSDLFDLVLVDEAHHVPATSWEDTVAAFPAAKKVFFTATPFRRDRKEIKGRMAFNYPLSKAYEDKIFGDIGFYPIATTEATKDVDLAKEVEKIFIADRAAGLKHYLMVRTDSKSNAAELEKIYAENTSLKLRSINSSKSYKKIKETIEKLRNKEIDGVICVDMLGEGFDFPNLKIAAIHKVHKSLAVTLQFIGRFARTNAENIGQAKFISALNDVEIGRKQLYSEGAIWNNIIVDLSEQKILEEDETKAVLDTFEDRTDDTQQNDISFYNINPYCHMKIYGTEDFNINGNLDFLNQEVVFHSISTEQNAVVFITKETTKPKWIVADTLVNVNYNLFFIFCDEDTGLLFIHSSIKSPQFYELLVKQFTTGNVTKISKYDINKVLANLEETEFFNIGMQNRSPNSGESYRTIAGQNAEKAVRESHGRLYANGHVFGKAQEDGENLTIGYSSGSKVWSNAYRKIPALINWSKKLAQKISSDVEVKTNTGLDNLSIGKVVTEFPLKVLDATWNRETFATIPMVHEMDEEGVLLTSDDILDYSIEIDHTGSTNQLLIFKLTKDNITIPLTYDFENYYQFEEVLNKNYQVYDNGVYIPLLQYLNDNSLLLYLEEFAIMENHEYHEPPIGNLHFNPERISSFDWTATNTDIGREFYENPTDKINNGNRNSIHETIREHLSTTTYDAIIYDHGSGEMADYVTFSNTAMSVEINLYHIKGSSGDEPGDRVNDVYEVCMQAVKSQENFVNKQNIKNKIDKRTASNPQKFIVGDIAAINTLLAQNKRVNVKCTVVQPGVSSGTLSAKLSTVFAAADDFLQNSGCLPLEVIGS